MHSHVLKSQMMPKKAQTIKIQLFFSCYFQKQPLSFSCFFWYLHTHFILCLCCMNFRLYVFTFVLVFFGCHNKLNGLHKNVSYNSIVQKSHTGSYLSQDQDVGRVAFLSGGSRGRNGFLAFSSFQWPLSFLSLWPLPSSSQRPTSGRPSLHTAISLWFSHF